MNTKLLDGLNHEQREAALHTQGPLLIVAGAGTGKTRTLTHRIAHLIEQGVAPHAILAITFTNKAAAEMRERVFELIGENTTSKPTLRTFHSLGVFILKQHAEKFGMSRYFTILDHGDSLSLVKRAMKNMGYDPKVVEPRKILNAISRAKGESHGVEFYLANVNNAFTENVAAIWNEYERLKKQEKAFDFADLLLKTFELLRDHADVLQTFQNHWQYIHIDEYQDTNHVQYEIARLLASPKNNLCVVGDGDQNIYSWRGANIRNILNFEKDFPGAKTVILEKNYRSTQNILKAAHAVIKKNTQRIDKKLVTDNHTGDAITIFQAMNGGAEASYIAEKVSHLIHHEDVSPADIAVLFRTNFQSRALEEAFMGRALPYQVVGVRFFERKEIKNIMAYIRAALNPESLSDIGRIINEPKRGIGKVTVAKIFNGQADTLTASTRLKYERFLGILNNIRERAAKFKPSEFIRYVIQESGIEKQLSEGTTDEKERLENLKELVTYATRYDHHDIEFALEMMMEDIALLSDQDEMDEKNQRKETTKLMTIHAAKGLEFKYVFVTGLEQGLFPSERGTIKRDDQEEERRLFYVAITRAKQKLFLTYAQFRRIYGQQNIQTPSEFLSDIDDSIATWETASEAYADHEDTPTFYLDF